MSPRDVIACGRGVRARLGGLQADIACRGPMENKEESGDDSAAAQWNLTLIEQRIYGTVIGLQPGIFTGQMP
jgi:hypothetical protein